MAISLAGCGSATLRHHDDAAVSDTDASLDLGAVSDAGARTDNGGASDAAPTDSGRADTPAGSADGGTRPRLLEGSLQSLGGVAKAGNVRIYDDGFEFDERRCAGAICVRGAITP